LYSYDEEKKDEDDEEKKDEDDEEKKDENDQGNGWMDLLGV
jgi:hypothetical protein